MSKTGVNSTPIKQESNPFKKDNRGPNSSSMKDDKRSSDSFSSPSSRNQGGPHGNQQNRDRSSHPNQNRNQNDSRQFDKSAPESKNSEKEDKNVADQQAAGEKKFTGRCRLFVGNLTPDVTEDDFKKMFEPYGEVSEVYVNTSRGFGFIRLDYRHNAEAAKAGLDGLQRKGRILRVRFATHGAALKVKNLHPYVSNELLEQSFSQFGELERCIVIVDDRGKPTGEGIVEFVRKPGANSALRRIKEGVFLMGVDPKPVAVEPLEQKDEEDGMPEKFLTKTDQYKKEREKEPRFAPPGTFEYEFGMRWKQLEELEKQRIEQIKKDTEEARLKLEDEMQNALYEYQAEQIRQDLIRQQEELRRLEELRNQDRLRRQQEMEMRRQQDERERAQQEERRRADMMMNMRQQEIARGRPLDPPLRGRDDLLMADRYGDRLPDRIPDRMPDRLGDRIPERMGDRMGPSQGGFMWDEKQRGEAGMRGEGGRGRDVRGAGAPPLQPPPVPPASMGAMERGGPAAAAAAAQNAKSNPKPLMQASGFGPQGSGGPGGASAPGDANPMEEDCTVETTPFLDTEEPIGSEVSPENTSPEDQPGTVSYYPSDNRSACYHDSSSEELPTTCCSMTSNQEQCKPAVKDDSVDLWETDTDYRISGNRESENLHTDTSKDLIPSHSELATEICSQDSPDTASDPQDVDYRLKQFNSPSQFSPHCISAENTPNLAVRCHSEERYSSSSYQSCDEDCSGLRIGDYTRARSVESFSAGSDSGSSSEKVLTSVLDSIKGGTSSEDMKVPTCKPSVTESFMTDECREHFTPVCNQLEKDSGVDIASESYESSNNVGSDDSEPASTCGLPIQRYLSSDNNMVQPEDTYQSACASSEDGYLSAGIPPPPASTPSCSQSTLAVEQVQISEAIDSYESSLTSNVCNTAIGASCLTNVVDTIDNVAEDANFSTTKFLQKNTFSYNQTANTESDYKQTVDVEVYKSSEENEYKPSTISSECKHISGEGESCYQQSNPEDSSDLNYKDISNDKQVSSYKQHTGDDSEEMDAETLDEEDMAHASMSPSIYQSYEEGIMAAHYHTAAMAVGVPVMEQYKSSDQTSRWSAVNEPDILPTSSTVPSGSYNSSVYTSTQNTVTVAATHLSKDQAKTSSSSASSSVPSSQSQVAGPNNEEDHEGALCTGDQTFKSAAARQSALVPFMKPAQSRPFASNISPSLYAGTAMVQGVNGPTVLTSSAVHIAQHPGGATIMRHQSMSTGLSGGMAQAAVMQQQQAMQNGVQATTVVQQRTLTNGQTMVVQQRTMSTGLAAVAQQRVPPPGSIAQAAMLHASALRQRAMLTQQANMMQHRAVRLVQARMVGSPMLRTQTLGGPALIQTGSSTPTLLHPSFVRGVSQGSLMQQLVRQRYLGGPVMPGRGIQMVPGRPIRVKMTYPREALPMESNT